MAINDKLEDRRRTRIRLLWLTAALLLVALIVSWIRDPEAFALFTGSLSVSTAPQGAEVFIDGKSVGVTPLHIARLPEGRKTLLLTHRFHRNLVEQIDIVSGEELVVERELPQATGSLSIVSNPTGGSIELDGETLAATTPLDLTDVTAGTHQVRVGYSNHRTMTQDVDVLPDENTRVVMDLILVPWGTLTVKTVPAGATVTLIGVDEVYQPGMELPLGDYAIEVKKAGYPSVSERVRVGMGDNIHTVTLRRLEVPLQVDVVPADAQVTLEYQLDGLTRVRPYASRVNVPMGKVTVLARAKGYRTERKSVTLGEEGARVQMRLKKFSVAAGESFRDKLRSGGEGPLLTVVGPGSFRMGDITGVGALNEQPVHEVHLTQPFAVGVYEISAGEFARYQRAVGADASSNEADPEQPAVNISFKQAQDYLRWLSDETGYQYRLPSEAEWEYFARAGVETPYVMSATPETLCDYANIADQSTRQVFREWDVAKCTDGFARIAPVGRLKPNAFGLFDVSGNVSEWVADCWSENYEQARDDETPYQEGQFCSRVFRGGSWDSQPETVRLSYRQSSDRANDDRGLRVVREL